MGGFLAAAGLFLLPASENPPAGTGPEDCRHIAGTWKESYSGVSCTGEKDEGKPRIAWQEMHL
jgi:hypothetical protein